MTDNIEEALANADEIAELTGRDKKDVIADLCALFSSTGSMKEGFISVADDVTGVYAVDGISGLSTMTTAAAVA